MDAFPRRVDGAALSALQQPSSRNLVHSVTSFRVAERATLTQRNRATLKS
jgi:hypothetical protein